MESLCRGSHTDHLPINRRTIAYTRIAYWPFANKSRNDRLYHSRTTFKTQWKSVACIDIAVVGWGIILSWDNGYKNKWTQPHRVFAHLTHVLARVSHCADPIRLVSTKKDCNKSTGKTGRLNKDQPRLVLDHAGSWAMNNEQWVHNSNPLTLTTK